MFDLANDVHYKSHHWFQQIPKDIPYILQIPKDSSENEKKWKLKGNERKLKGNERTIKGN